MLAVCQDVKDVKHIDKQTTIISQLYRAFNRYPDCDKKRVQPCQEVNKNTRKA